MRENIYFPESEIEENTGFVVVNTWETVMFPPSLSYYCHTGSFRPGLILRCHSLEIFSKKMSTEG